MGRRLPLMLLVVVIAALSGFFIWNSAEEEDSNKADNEVTTDDIQELIQNPNEVSETSEPAPGVRPLVYNYFGTLEDVTATETTELLRGVETNGLAGGSAEFTYQEGIFYMNAIINSLPTPNGDDFYEGWLVRQDPFEFISTGVLDSEGNGVYTNVFESTTDFTDFNQYVLTIEPNDGDPAPAGHIVEGFLSLR